MKPIWIVDDDQSIRFVLEKALLREGLPTRSFTHPREVLAALDRPGALEGPQVLVSDIRMPGGSGLDLLSKVKERLPVLPVIIMTAFSDLDSAVSAFQSGAFEYLPKPFDLPKAIELIRRAVEESQREEVSAVAQEETPEMLGQAPAMQDVFRAIGRLSQSHVTVMITGESGSGKELVARALHKHSPRANGPFVAINTAAIPKDLLESELFGHKKGSFTGAVADKPGLFEVANGGTLFLDEIGELPLPMQVKLLRALQERVIRRVGGNDDIKLDVRIVAATNRNLETAVKKGTFREDLYYRLNVIMLETPALRDRKGDVAILAQHFLKKFNAKFGKELEGIDPPALKALESHKWPGNVRELENVMERAVALESGTSISESSLEGALRSDPLAGGIEGGSDRVAFTIELPDLTKGPISLDGFLKKVERLLVQKAITASSGNEEQAARLLQTTRNRVVAVAGK